MSICSEIWRGITITMGIIQMRVKNKKCALKYRFGRLQMEWDITSFNNLKLRSMGNPNTH
jgi:hypothetical protein